MSDSLRVTVFLNNGQHRGGKPIIIKTDDWDAFVKSACNKLKIKGNKKNTRVFSSTGEEVKSFKDLQQGEELFISPKGEDFIQVDLKKKEKKIPKHALAPEERVDENMEELSYSELQKERQRLFIKVNNKKMSKMPLGMNEIYDGIFIGSARDSIDEEQLRKYQITHMLNTAMGWKLNNKILEWGIIYCEVLIDDVQHEKLEPHFEKAFNFMDMAKKLNEKPKILVHCMSGKSRSVAVVIAYLMKRYKMRLKEAYNLVIQNRKIAKPNPGFIQQLMDYDLKLYNSVSLTWDEIPSSTSSFQEWLITNAPDRRDKQPTHLWCEILIHKRFHVPSFRREEFFSEYAKAVQRGELLKLVEIASLPKYNLHLNIDIKYEKKEGIEIPSLEKMIQFFIPGILKVFEKMFNDQRNTKFSITGTMTPFMTREVNYKYGYHLIWPNVQVTTIEHKSFVDLIIEHFQQEENIKKIIPEEILKFNEWNTIFNVSIFSGEITLRLLYSSKVNSCKSCKKLKKNEKCLECNDTGMRDGRVYKHLGLYSSKNGELIELLPEKTVTDIRRIIENNSILVWS